MLSKVLSVASIKFSKHYFDLFYNNLKAAFSFVFIVQDLIWI